MIWEVVTRKFPFEVKSLSAGMLYTESGLLADMRFADMFWCVNPSQGAKREYVIGVVGFGKQRPGQPEDSSIPQVRMAIAACWEENPGDRKTATELLCILSANA